MTERTLLGLIEEALAQPVAERERWLRQRCDDADFPRARQLLASALALDTAPPSPGQLEAVTPGSVIGPYRLLERIGSGGMGDVYRGERADGAFEQRVAIKVLRGAIASEVARQQFSVERQILARLTHPNIAALHDGGTLSGGLPYFVLEYVEGKPLHDYLSESNPPWRERIETFVKIVDAVAYAHRSLIIHRDIKPSNIVVQPDGEPKLLDFGIAKSLENPAPNDHTVGSAHTPRFASPEQLDQQPLTTATDIYSLGLVLYVLLTGSHPFGESVSDRGRRLRDDPPKPSTRWSLGLSKAAASELDAITLQALAPSPADRYGSAADLARDLRRFLSGDPVQARGRAFGYLARKFLRRHGIWVGASALALCGLLVGAIVANRQAVEAEMQRERAERDAAVASDAIGFLRRVLWTSNPWIADPEPITVAALLDRADGELSEDILRQPESRAYILALLTELYSDRGKAEKALATSTQALDIVEQQLGDDNPYAATVYRVHGLAMERAGQVAESYPVLRHALGLYESLERPDRRGHADTLNRLGNVAYFLDQHKEAEGYFRRAIELRRPLEQLEPGESAVYYINLSTLLGHQRSMEAADRAVSRAIELFRRDPREHARLASALANRGRLLAILGDLAGAEALYLEAIDSHSTTLGPGHHETVFTAISLGDLYEKQQRYDDAKAVLKPLLAFVGTEQLPANHWISAYLKLVTGSLLCEQAEGPAGEALLRDAVAIRSEIYPAGNFSIISAQHWLGVCLADQARFETASELLLPTLAAMIEQRGADHAVVAQARERTKAIYERWGRPLPDALAN